MPSSLFIEERTGNSGTDRSIELRGAALPFQGANWGAELNMVTQFNPGNAEGTQHVLGPQEAPSSWEGYWNTTRMIVLPTLYNDPSNGVANQPIVRADTLQQLLEALYRGGALLRVTWSGEPGRRIVRLGHARSWDFKFVRFDDIKWTTQFEWVSRGQETQVNVTQFQAESLMSLARAVNLEAGLTVANAWAHDIAKRNSDIADAEAGPTLFQLSQLTALALYPVTVLDDLGNQASRYQKRLLALGDSLRDFRVAVESTPTALSERANDIGTGIVETANKFARKLTQQPPEVICSRSRAATVLRIHNYNGRVYDANARMGARGDVMSRSARRQLSALDPTVLSRSNTHRALTQDVLRVYIPSATDTMVTISLKFYSTDVHAPSLARANGLPGYTIKPPHIPLIIPILATIQKQSVKNV